MPEQPDSRFIAPHPIYPDGGEPSGASPGMSGVANLTVTDRTTIVTHVDKIVTAGAGVTGTTGTATITVTMGGNLVVTDGTHSVANVAQITVDGGTVSGVTPDAVITISPGGNLVVTDGTHTVSGVSKIDFVNATISGTSPNATATIGVSIQTGQFRNQQVSGAPSGETLTANNWTSRALNSEIVSGIIGASLSGLEMVLPAGTYNISASAGSQATASITNYFHQLRLRNQDDGTTLVAGVGNAYAGGANDAVVNAFLQGQFVLSGTKHVTLDSYVTALCSGGNGQASGEAQVYVDVLLEKIA